MRKIPFYFLMAIMLMQCASPKNACIDVTSIQQKHEKLPNRLTKANREENDSFKKNEFPVYERLIPAELHSGIQNQNDQAVLEIAEEYSVSTLSNRVDRSSNKQLEKRIAKLKIYLDDHYLGSDTTLRDQQPQIDLFDLQHRKAKRLGIASLLAIIAYPIPVIGFIAFVTSIVLGFKSLKEYKKSLNKQGRGFAIASLVINGITIALFLIAIIALLFWLSGGGWG